MLTFSPVSVSFFIMALFTIGGGLGVVTTRNLVHAALFLVLSLFGIAGLYVLLEAPYLAVIQVLVYVGAISILITITVMVTRRLMGIEETYNRQWPIAAIISGLLGAGLIALVVAQFGALTPVADVPVDNIEQLGRAFVTHQGFLLPFEVASVLLLAAMIGSIVISRDV
ncbi:MAG: NADH-quinone oxidoreductase subunit J [Chloroflexi bacterium]|nr:NADH-quinone oxidoreductase subunit J [Chloroflexota bacterium]